MHDTYVRCPICGGAHRLMAYDPYDGRMGSGTEEYYILCGNFTVTASYKKFFKEVDIAIKEKEQEK